MRRTAGATVLEGVRVVEGALARDATILGLYVDERAPDAVLRLAERVRDAGTTVRTVRTGVLGRVGDVVTSPGMLAVAALASVTPRAFADASLVVVAVDVADPGNAGSLLRSAEAAGAAGVVFCGDSVDVRNPKVARASAGACFGVAVGEGDDPVDTLETLRSHGLRRLGTAAAGGTPPEAHDLTVPVAFVVGGEARGLPAGLERVLEGHLTIPMQGAAESLNVATAAAVCCFEAARQRREAGELR